MFAIMLVLALLALLTVAAAAVALLTLVVLLLAPKITIIVMKRSHLKIRHIKSRKYEFI